jgi:hypothetical protein
MQVKMPAEGQLTIPTPLREELGGGPVETWGEKLCQAGRSTSIHHSGV